MSVIERSKSNAISIKAIEYSKFIKDCFEVMFQVNIFDVPQKMVTQKKFAKNKSKLNSSRRKSNSSDEEESEEEEVKSYDFDKTHISLISDMILHKIKTDFNMNDLDFSNKIRFNAGKLTKTLAENPSQIFTEIITILMVVV